MRSANDEVVLIAQIENRSGLENVERIAAVDGINLTKYAPPPL
ncbi:MAG: aldolase/citrate lyase family protein [Pseudomonadota bacterium]|nr:aldolase/citrate lyase family protein [Pseudomonadota bacterium]